MAAPQPARTHLAFGAVLAANREPGAEHAAGQRACHQHQRPVQGCHRLIDADVFVPERGVGGDEILHHLDALRVLEVDDFDAGGTHEVGALAAFGVGQEALAAGESLGLSDDDFGDAELDGGAAAQVAGHEGGVEGGITIRFLAAGAGEAVDFGVGHGVAVLDAAIVAGGDHLAVADKDAADGQAAFGEAFAGLLDGGGEEGGVFCVGTAVAHG